MSPASPTVLTTRRRSIGGAPSMTIVVEAYRIGGEYRCDVLIDGHEYATSLAPDEVLLAALRTALNAMEQANDYVSDTGAGVLNDQLDNAIDAARMALRDGSEK